MCSCRNTARLPLVPLQLICFTPLFSSSSIFPCFLLSPSLNLFSRLFVLAASLAYPCGRAFKNIVSDISNAFVAGASLCISMHMSVAYSPHTTYDIQGEYSLISLLEPIPLTNSPVVSPHVLSHYKLPNCTNPSVYTNGPRICSGCFGRVFYCYAFWLFSVCPFASLLHVHVFVFLSSALMLSFPISVFWLFLLALFHPV